MHCSEIVAAYTEFSKFHTYAIFQVSTSSKIAPADETVFSENAALLPM